MVEIKEALADRRALEALRSGVPNEDAVRVLGCDQPGVESRYLAGLDAVESAIEQDVQEKGLLIAGGFGTGKSHVLEYLEHLATSRGFITSRIVISKETPLYDRQKVFRAAVQSARVPGRTGPAIPEIAVTLRTESSAYAKLYQWANHDTGISPLFPATLLLHERLRNDPDLVQSIENFWAGDPLPVARVRDGLRQIGEAAAFSLRAVRARDLTEQRFKFASRLMIGAGYRGWILLIDEVELIGRYSLMQRGRSYAELARWLGHAESGELPGVLAVAAVTDDFALAVIQQKGDRDYVGAKLRDKGTDEMITTAARAESGMRAIERDAILLSPPTAETLYDTYQKLREIHGRAYAWHPGQLETGLITHSRRMRSHVRRWINEWDLERLFPGQVVQTVEQELKPSYAEDETLEESAEGSDEPGSEA